MSTTVLPNNVKALADLIEADIRHRGLQSGDPYLSASEAAKHFRVGLRSANSALQLLEQRRIVKRRQRLGSVVTLSHHASLPESQINVVHLIVHESHLKKEGMLTDGCVVGLQNVLPKADIQFNYLPDSDETGYVNGLIHSALKSKRREGFVVIRSSLETQRAIGRSGMPAVVFGTVCPTVENVSSIDSDQAQAGRLIVQYFLRLHCKRMLVLMRNQIYAGDHLFLDALRNASCDGGIGDKAAIYRFLALDEDAVLREVLKLARESFSEKCGILCFTQQIASRISQLIDSLKLPADRQPEIVVSGYYKTSNAHIRFPYIETEITSREVGKRIGKLLIEQALSKAIPRHDYCPVKIVMPDDQ